MISNNKEIIDIAYPIPNTTKQICILFIPIMNLPEFGFFINSIKFLKLIS
jgi:hypothetical protein